MPTLSLRRDRPRRARLGLHVAVATSELRARADGGGDRRAWRMMVDALADRGVVMLDGDHRRARRRADAWLVSGSRPLSPALRRDHAVPVVCHLHEAPWEDPAQRELLHPAFVASMTAWGREATARAIRVVCDSRHGAREIAAVFGVPAQRIDAVPLACDHAVFRPGRPRPAVIGPGIYVLFVGAAHPRKNLPTLRRAMQLLAGHPNAGPARLVCVLSPASDRPDPETLMVEAASPLDGVELQVLSGLDEGELTSLYSHAALLALPSLSEGFGLPALEAMACGTPVVVSDRGALPEVVGDAGVVCQPEAAPLAAAMHRLLTDVSHREERSAAGLRRASQFTWSRTAQGLHASLQRAVEEG
ncbi:MAG: glycosyltransferase [Actinomycetota bacterium]|nr:glycosyltransferase [Actinomycetota bacterium]